MKASEILSILALARPALATSPFIPAYQHFCIDTDCITATNGVLVTTIARSLGFEGEPDGALLLKLLQSLGDRELTFTRETNHLKISASRSKFKVTTLDGTYPYPVVSDRGTEFPISPCFLQGLKTVLVSVGLGAGRPEQQGVVIDQVGGYLTLFTTDNVTISRYVTDNLAPEIPLPFLLPRDFCDALLSMTARFKGGVSLLVGDHEVSATVGEDALLATSIEAPRLPDFDQICQSFEQVGASVPLDPMWLEIATRSAFLQDDDPMASIRVTVTPRAITTSVQAAKGAGDEVLPLVNQWTPQAFNIHPGTLVRGLKLCNTINIASGAIVLSKGPFQHFISTRAL